MYRILNELLQPYTLLVLLLLAAYLNLWRRRRETRRRLTLLAVPLALLLIVSTPAVSYLAFATLERQFEPLRAPPREKHAIVVLGGWLLGSDDFRARPVLSAETVERCFEAAELYRRSGRCLVVATGGAIDDYDPTSIARLMRDFLVGQGVSPADVLEEGASFSTYENATECHKLLSERGITRVVLVTDALHLRRAAGCFRQVGFDVTPAPCNYQTSRFEVRPSTFLPSVGAARGSQQVFHEWLGLCWYWLHGRL